jgi:diguanylate cyclase (GGDEF)-like protein
MSDDGRIEEHGAARPLPLADEDISPQAEAAILRLVAEIDRLREEIAANNKRIAHLEQVADRDPLTPTVNRRAFIRELERTKAYVDRYKAPAAVIYLDLDGMKAINDRYGHATGDEVLVAVARTLMGNVRSSDTVGRLGGDEFGIILPHADPGAAEEKAATLATLLADIRIGPEGEAMPISVTWGVETLVGAADAAAALDAADRAMYARKRKGGGPKRS